MANRFRIARTPRSRYTPLQHNGAPVIDAAAAILPVLRRELPPAWGTLLAEPRRRDDDIDWWAEGLGNAVPLASLPAHEQGKLRAVLDERLEHLRALAGHLRAGDAALADALLLAGRYPGPECIHTIAGQPVLIFWGHAEAGAAVLPAGPPPFTPSAPASGGAASGGAPGAGTNVGAGAGLGAGLSWRSGMGIGLALFLLLLFAGTLAWWLRLWPFAGAFGVGGELLARLEREEGRGSALEAEVAALERQIDDARKVCRAPDPPKPPPARADLPKAEPTKAEPPPPEPSKPEPPAAVLPPPAMAPVEPPRAVEVPPPRPKPPVPAETPREAPAAVPAEPARETPPPAQAKACPAPRQPWEAPEVVFALDASGSMGFPYGLSDQEEASILAGLRRGDPSAVARAQQIYGTRPGDRRIDHAKGAMNTAVDRLPGDVDAGLVVFGECRSTDNFHFFKPGERGRLKGIVQGIQPRQGTPLARGIERAANMMEAGDPKRPAVIVVLSDGHDSCGGDPCATARALKQRKPGLVINVVQVTNGESASCLARETGGKVFNAREAGGVLPAVQKATGQAPVPAECRNR